MTNDLTRLDFSVRAYEAGEVHAPHYDDAPRISLLLHGGYAEETGRGGITAAPGDVLIKGNEVRHENRFGRDGALLASIAIAEDDHQRLPAAWVLQSDGETLADATTMMEAALAGSRAGLAAAVFSILARLQPEEKKRGTAPRWIGVLKSDLEEAGFETVDVAARARAAGVHPAYASALFRRHVGASITCHARFHAVRRATAMLGGAMSLKDVALAAGFYDQSHMNRSFKRVTGRTPAAWRRLSGEVRALAS